MKDFFRRFLPLGLCLLLLLGQAGVPLLVHGCTEEGTAEASIYMKAACCCEGEDEPLSQTQIAEEAGCCFSQTAWLKADFQGPLTLLKAQAAPMEAQFLLPYSLVLDAQPVALGQETLATHPPAKAPPAGRARLAMIQVLRI